MKRLAREIAAGAGNGVVVALAYVIVEFVLLTLAPLVRYSELGLGSPFWHSMELLVAGYIVCGAALGAVAGGLLALLGPSEITGQLRLLTATIVLPFAFAANLLARRPLSGAGAVSVGIAMLAVLAMIISIRSAEWQQRFAFLLGPLTLSALLLMPLRISHELSGHSGLLRLAVIAGALLGITLVSSLFNRLRLTERVSLPYPVGLMVLLVLTCGAGPAMSSRSAKLPRRAIVASKRPSVILIVMDTVRADHTSLYGYERDTTPYLRELAKEATLYRRAVAVSDFTLPTHASMFTGLYPRTHGAYFAPPNYPGGRPLSQRFNTLAEVLQANGYRTAGIVANSGYLSPGMGFAQGFELYDWRSPLNFAPSMQPYYLRRGIRELLDRVVSTSDFELRTRRAKEINQETYRVLDQIDSPFFLFLNYMDAHNPYVPPPPFDRLYTCANPTLTHVEPMASAVAQVLSGKRESTAEEQTCYNSGYDGGIAYIDSQIRELVGVLRTRGLYDNTMLIVTGDHGEALGGRKQLGHGGISVYQSEVGVPLLVKYPGTASGSQVSFTASQVDLLPTILDVASIPEQAGVQGVSLRKLESSGPRSVVSMSYPDPWLVGLNRKYDRIEQALLSGDKKLVESTAGKRELFDLSRDAGEEQNLYGDGDPDSLALSDMLQKWIHSIPAAALNDRGTTDRTTLERLKSLGYAQ